MLLGLIALGSLPSLIWLSIYLNEDEHPEPNRFILKIFFIGALSAPIAAGIEYFLINSTGKFGIPVVLENFLVLFVFIGIVEEYIKFAAVKVGMFRNPAFDEPADAMIYLIVSGLGFAALENILAIFHFVENSKNVIGEAIEITALRFLSSTVLHVLASAILGYYFAKKHFFLKKFSLIYGIILAGFLHGAYNTLTMISDNFTKIIPTIVVVSMLGLSAILVNILFYKLKRGYNKTICQKDLSST